MNCTLEFATQADFDDPLKEFRSEFLFPSNCCAYLCGNSLGLQSKKSREYVIGSLEKWSEEGVEGHFKNTGLGPWVTIDELCVKNMAVIVGALPVEVAIMNSLTVNLHLMMVSFYRPTQMRHKIIIEAKAFPSDYIAVRSQILEKGFDPDTSLVIVSPREGEEVIRTEDILQAVESNKESVALLLFSGLQYYSGQIFEMEKITKETKRITCNECMVGFDLAHAVGNAELRLNEWGVDFAVWCTYKYLNSGPGGVGGVFVHSKHHDNEAVPRFSGWWGHRKQDRFMMDNCFIPSPGAFGWQMSNPSVLSLVCLHGSLELFAKATMLALRTKSRKLTQYLEDLLNSQIPAGEIKVITPTGEGRGCQLSLVFRRPIKEIHSHVEKQGVICDMREPNVMRIAPAPLYNSFEDVHHFVMALKSFYAK